MKTWVIGHKNPDTDSVVSAIVYAEKTGALPARAGELNPETKFVLERFSVPAPELRERIEKGERVVIVDTNNAEELVPIEGEIVEIIDHHRLFGNLSTPSPISVLIEPVGSTSTLIAERFIHELEPREAGLLLCGVLSDTVVFRSPTTTERDRKIAKMLAEKAGIQNIESFGMELKSKASALSEDIRENILRDFKIISAKSAKFGVSQLELVSYEPVMSRKEEYLGVMEELRKEKSLDYVLLMVSNIMDGDTKLLIAGDSPERVARAFGKEMEEERCVFLENVLSRKKQVVPVLQEHF